jgi:hypothetical protein
MTEQILNMDDFMPHCVVPSDKVHVIPKIIFEKVANGTMKFSEIDDSDDIARQIVKEWMEK